MKKTKILLLWMTVVILTAGCVLTIHDNHDNDHPYVGKTPTVTNTIVITNEIGGGVYTNTEYVSNYTVISNEYIYTNDRYYTNTVTNVYYVTNTLAYSLEIGLTAPIEGAIVGNSVSVSGIVGGADTLLGAIVFVESTNGAMVSSDYSAIDGDTFSANITVSQQGIYQVWATAWDSVNAMGISEKVSFIADWTPPSLTVTQPESKNITLNPEEGEETVDCVIEGIISDSYSGGQQVYIQVDCCTCIYIDTTGAFEETLTLSNGVHNVSITARDNAGYTSLPQLYTITVE